MCGGRERGEGEGGERERERGEREREGEHMCGCNDYTYFYFQCSVPRSPVSILEQPSDSEWKYRCHLQCQGPANG